MTDPEITKIENQPITESIERTAEKIRPSMSEISQKLDIKTFDTLTYSHEMSALRKSAVDRFLSQKGILGQADGAIGEDEGPVTKLRRRKSTQEAATNPIVQKTAEVNISQTTPEVEDELAIMEEVLFTSTLKRNMLRRDQGISNLVELTTIPDEETKHQLAELIRQGWRLGDTKKVLGSEISRRNLPELVAKASRIQEKIMQDPEYASFLGIMREFSGITSMRSMGPMVSSIEKGGFPLTLTELSKLDIDQDDSYNIVRAASGLAFALTPETEERKRLINSFKLKMDYRGNMALDYSLQGVDWPQVNPSTLFMNKSDQVFWEAYKKGATSPRGVDPTVMHFMLTEYPRFSEYLQEGRLTEDFYQKLATKYIQNDSKLKNRSVDFLLNPDICPERFLELRTLYQSLDPDSQAALCKHIGEWSSFYKDGGVPQSSLFFALAKEGQIATTTALLETNPPTQLPPTEQVFWQKWQNLSPDLQLYIAANMESLDELTEQIVNNIEYLPEIIARVSKSSSKEVQRIKDQVVLQVLDADNPVAKADDVVSIFEREDLPEIAKTYRVFEMLYPPEKFDEMIRTMSSRADMSPVLVQSDTKARYEIIYKDLLGVHIDSANPSLYAYLDARKDGPIDDKTQSMILEPLGVETVQEVLDRMDNVKRQAHERNIRFAEEVDVANNQAVKLGTGDLLKGSEVKYFDMILENGLVAKEYLGSAADSDRRTPFDTDTSMILPEDSDSMQLAVASSLARNYGDVIFVVREKGQFHTTQSDAPAQYDPDTYELFNSRTLGKRHFGIRTGLPMTQVDCVIAQRNLTEDPDKKAMLDRIFFQIAQNEFYIPVVNLDGEIIFSPQDYERYKFKSEPVKEALHDDAYTPKKLIDAFKKTRYLKDTFEQSFGSSEGYDLETHSIGVEDQFEENFAQDWNSPLLTKDNFRLMLGLHDLGKPFAYQVTGSTMQQHEYTLRFVPKILNKLDIPPKETNVMIEVINQDLIGEYMQGKLTAEDTVTSLRNKATILDVPVDQLFDLISTYYMCDASSYTETVSGKKSLDHLFIMNDRGGELRFSPQAQAKFDVLPSLIATA